MLAIAPAMVIAQSTLALSCCCPVRSLRTLLMTQLQSAFTIFLSLLVEALPFLLLGVLLSSALLLFVDESRLIRLIPKNPLLGALAGSTFGFLFPVCECGNVPVARRFLIQGFPPSVAIGFLLAAPTINPIVIWSTWTAFRDQPEIVILRVAFSLTVATLLAWTFSAQADLRPLLQPVVARCVPQPQPAMASATSPLLRSGTFWLGDAAGQRVDAMDLQTQMLTTPSEKLSFQDRLNLLLANCVQELRELGGVLILGSAIAAAIQVGVPREIILSVGTGPISSIVAMMVLAAVVSICSTVDSFFALSFASTFTTGSLLAFLVFGPMIDLKAIGLMLSIFKGRAIIYLFGLAAQLVFILTFSYQMLN